MPRVIRAVTTAAVSENGLYVSYALAVSYTLVVARVAQGETVTEHDGNA